MKTIRVLSEQEAQRVASMITGLPLPFTITIGDGDKRSLSQNALLWRWNGEIAKWRGDTTAEEVHQENKFLIGCSILMRDDENFVRFVERLSGLSYEEKLDAMDYLSVTSIMTPSQMSEFMDNVYRKFSQKGCPMTLPEIIEE